MQKLMRHNAAARQILSIRAAYRCSFPGCNIELSGSSGRSFLEICHIEAISQGGSRHNADRSGREFDLENLIVLCPNHHRLIDADRIMYTAEWLRKAKRDHEASVAASAEPESNKTALAQRRTSFHESLRVWKDNVANGNEEFWHRLFVGNPKLLAQAMPNCVIKIGDKCYVGGKLVSNSGGKLTDFIYATKSTKNVVLVEIKTPVMPLLGAEYRAGVHAISEHLTGSIVQVLAYRDAFLKHFHVLTASEEGDELRALDPICFVLAGNLTSQIRAAAQRDSFELFRANSGVIIITYDELFAKIEALVEMLDDDAG
jgi:hypothetical protein